MTTSELILYLGLTALTANLVRVLPMLLIRGRIRNRFVRSFLYYVPYVTLAVMTFPSILLATQSPWAGLAALLLGIVVAWRGWNLFSVATLCCVTVFVLEFFL
ncbi:MAG: AzlD domain-containing protein [Bacteroidales bacterium]|nr:AzlD domain-containing protein [Bacteroidales bacterium]